MIILYRPEGQEPPQHFDVRSVRTSEAQIVQRTTDMTWGQIKDGVRRDDPTAMRGVVWILMKRREATLRWSDFDPTVDELTSRYDAREVAAIAADIVQLPEEKQPATIAELRQWALDPESVAAALQEAAQPPKDQPTTETSTPDV
ncbi:hypothetical protein ACFWCB_26380 [Streptomyces sp. NPDC060048]|uniref:hypothetical protein n=1 Tax=unclassified Streptomyces TaxID=2593676 RepID=UPI00367D9E38